MAINAAVHNRQRRIFRVAAHQGRRLRLKTPRNEVDLLADGIDRRVHCATIPHTNYLGPNLTLSISSAHGRNLNMPDSKHCLPLLHAHIAARTKLQEA
jgi:hypothetical protein